jgi:hypothetical protein
MEAATLPSPLQKLLKSTLQPVALDAVAQGVIGAIGHEATRAEDMAPLIGSDARYRNYLFAQTFLAERMSEWVTENEGQSNRDQILLDRLLRLLGKTPVRNLIACASLERLVGDPDPKPSGGASQEGPPLGPGKDEGKITVMPSRVIPFALAAESACADRGWVHPETAFEAGLHYDWLAALIKKRKAPPDEKAALDAAFKEGLGIARMAYELGHRVGSVQHGKFIVAAGLLLPIGKPLMASLFPSSLGEGSWAKFAKSCEGDACFDRLLFLEPALFPVTHRELGCLFVNFGGLLRAVEKAIQFYLEPYRLKGLEPHLYQLAALLSVAARMARATKSDQKLALEPFHDQWMKDNRIDASTLKAAMAAALRA